MTRGRLAWLGYGLAALVLLGGLAWAVENYRFATRLGEARQAMNLGDYRSAGERLAALSTGRSGEAEVGYLLGVCEQMAGRPQAALDAWDRVPEGSPFSGELARRRAPLEIELGRFALAETHLVPATGEGESVAFEARQLLAQLYLMQGRLDEVRPLIEANWEELRRSNYATTAEALALLRTHVTLDLFPLPVEQIKAVLDDATRKAPEDDRVWLGQANLATSTGQYETASDRLEACLRRRPDDPAVWRGVLDWALAADRPDRARQALARIPADRYPAQRVGLLRAWFAARRGDAPAERQALERAVEDDPGDLVAVERLAERLSREGPSEREAELRRRKAELDRAKHDYRHLFTDGDPASNALALALLAEQLGRRFEARGFLALAAGRGAEGPEFKAARARIDGAGPAPRTMGQTLAALLAAELGPETPTTATTGSVGGAPSSMTIPRFRDDAAVAGLRFTFDNGASPIHQLPEMAAGGVGLIDYDGDGWLDVYAVQGGKFPVPPGRLANHDRLFRNLGHGRFEDVSVVSGIAALPGGFGHGVAVGDIDNDGRPDVFITRWRSYALYRNKGDGTFEDATDRWGLGGDRNWPTSAAFSDLDGDGDLDLYVCHYLVWDPDNPRLCRRTADEAYISCDPHLFAALPDQVYRNDGGRFVDMTAASGIADPDGRGLGVVAADLDDDGKIDLYVANDGTANLLFHNLGGFRFEEVGHLAGAASNADGGYQAGMGVACGDLDGDGRVDLAVTNFYGESTTFFQNLGGGLFADRSAAIGLAAPSRYLLGFGVSMLDANSDGRLDLLSVNGHVSDFRPQSRYAMPAQLLIRESSGRLVDVSRRAGAPFLADHLARGLAVGDLDNDGRPDALAIVQNEPLVYLHNETRGGHYVTLSLEGTRSNRDGVGARVSITAGGRTQVALRFGGGSYQSAGDPRLNFGLGEARRIERLEVRWPSGRVDQFRDLEGGTGYRLREGAAQPERLKGWSR